MKIFILGGRGFVGSAFARLCERESRDYSVIDLDNYEEMRGGACELLVNADGNSRKYLAAADPLEDFRLSVLSVLRSFSDFKFEKYAYISSVDIYPDHSNPAGNHEEVEIDGGLLSNYGFHKLLGELLVKHYLSRWLIVRMGGVLGEGLKKNPIFDLINDVPLRVNEESLYQYLPIDYVAETLFKLAEEERWGETYNFCGEGTVSLREVRSWLGKPLRTAGEVSSPERYEINNRKLSRIAEVPRTRDVVKNFIEPYIGN